MTEERNNPSNNKEIFCTLGPASLNVPVIKRLEEIGVSLFRINLSHTQISDLPKIISFIQSTSMVPVCLDSEGAQIRTGLLKENTVELKEHRTIKIVKETIIGDENRFNLSPKEAFDQLLPGDILTIDFNSVLLQVVDISPNEINMRVLTGGIIGKNKAVTVNRNIVLPPLTEKDEQALAIGRDFNIRHVALSFAHKAEDVYQIRKHILPETFLMSKIECSEGLANLDEIIVASDAILVDRGDLSREEPIEKIPYLQKEIIRKTKMAKKKAYVATNLLESMISAPQPTRAEVNDIYNTLADGVDGLVLAGESAIGKYPVACATMVKKMIHEFSNPPKTGQNVFSTEIHSTLVEPHGGYLVQQIATSAEQLAANSLKKIPVKHTDLMDCEQIAFGTYSPLRGFMDRKELASTLEYYQLLNGVVWTLPIILQIPEEKIRKYGIRIGETVALCNDAGEIHSTLQISDIYNVDLEKTAKQFFGTDDINHPGVAKFFNDGKTCVGGKVSLVKRSSSQWHHYELTPSESRHIFQKKGWSKVVGFHTRNVAHRAHEFIQLSALEQTGADGIYLNPVIGPKKNGDWMTGPILESYQKMLELGVYPQDKAILGSFSTYSRYAGPREAVFTALARKNMGCSHFIIGRDHTGVGNYYQPEDNKNLFARLGNIGVTPVFFDMVGYHQEEAIYKRSTEETALNHISGTTARETLRSDKLLPDWYMRIEIQEMIKKRIKAGEKVFYES